MLKKTNTLKLLLSLTLTTASLATPLFAATGKEIAFDRKKGNCLACHAMDDGDMPGNIGPPLVAMTARFPDRAILKAQIFDATKRNPISIMPPFGKHEILNDAELEKIIDYLYTL
ncbi:MAG: sulfur oxidation c-type cytochrome SoxX [Cycloclasticus sp. symbiont of Poecilosclerida sp. M]|nr:MAG: sulfur oxidation c-type cytochrome SoxX [Cycloclasticus sp. symbiont of Poecilosclerida sp. M]